LLSSFLFYLFISDVVVIVIVILSTEKKRRKIVTPDEINSIFSKKTIDKNSNDNNDLFATRGNGVTNTIDVGSGLIGGVSTVDEDESIYNNKNDDNTENDDEESVQENTNDNNGIGGFANELGQKFAAAYAQAMNNVEDRSVTATTDENTNMDGSTSMDGKSIGSGRRSNLSSPSSSSMSSAVSAFDSNDLADSSSALNDKFSDASLSSDDQVPKWLIKADRAAEKKKKEQRESSTSE